MSVAIGFNRVARADGIGPAGLDGAGNPTATTSGVAVVIPPLKNAQQIDAILAASASNQVGLGVGNGVRVLVYLVNGNISGIAPQANALALAPGGTLTQVTNTVGGGWTLPDPSQTFGIQGAIMAADFSDGVSDGSYTGGGEFGKPIVFSGRPGGGLVIPENTGAIVVAYGVRYSTGQLIVAIRSTQSVSLMVCGGSLGPGQDVNASAAPDRVQTARCRWKIPRYRHGTHAGPIR